MSFIKFAITEYNGETEHDTTMVAEVPKDTTREQLDRALKAFLMDWYAGDADDWEDDTETKIWTPHQTLCWLDGDEAISGSEFSVLKKHMNDHTFNIKECLTKTA